MNTIDFLAEKAINLPKGRSVITLVSIDDAIKALEMYKNEGSISIEEINGENCGVDGLWHARRILEKTLGKVDGYQSDDGILDHNAAITAVKKLHEQKPIKWKQENTEELTEFENAMMH